MGENNTKIIHIGYKSIDKKGHLALAIYTKQEEMPNKNAAAFEIKKFVDSLKENGMQFAQTLDNFKAMTVGQVNGIYSYENTSEKVDNVNCYFAFTTDNSKGSAQNKAANMGYSRKNWRMFTNGNVFTRTIEEYNGAEIAELREVLSNPPYNMFMNDVENEKKIFNSRGIGRAALSMFTGKDAFDYEGNKLSDNFDDIPENRAKAQQLIRTIGGVNSGKNTKADAVLSVNNALFILSQDPDATYVTTEEAWLKSFNRVVIDKSLPVYYQAAQTSKVKKDSSVAINKKTSKTGGGKQGKHDSFVNLIGYDVRFTEVIDGEEDVFNTQINLKNNLSGEENLVSHRQNKKEKKLPFNDNQAQLGTVTQVFGGDYRKAQRTIASNIITTLSNNTTTPIDTILKKYNLSPNLDNNNISEILWSDGGLVDMAMNSQIERLKQSQVSKSSRAQNSVDITDNAIALAKAYIRNFFKNGMFHIQYGDNYKNTTNIVNDIIHNSDSPLKELKGAFEILRFTALMMNGQGTYVNNVMTYDESINSRFTITEEQNISIPIPTFQEFLKNIGVNKQELANQVYLQNNGVNTDNSKLMDNDTNDYKQENNESIKECRKIFMDFLKRL